MSKRAVILAVTLLCLPAAAAHAATAEETYLKKLSKKTVSFGDPSTWGKPKTLCLCTDGSGSNRRLGALALTGSEPMTAVCGVVSFNGSGDAVQLSACDEYVVIGK